MAAPSVLFKCRVDSARAHGRLHPERDRLAMQKPRVRRLGLQSVANRMAEVQNLAQAAFPLVGGNHFRLDPNRFGDDFVHHGGGRGQATSRRRSASKWNKEGLAITPHLITSNSPARYSRSGKVSRAAGSIKTAQG